MRLHHSWISPLNRSATLLLTASCLLAQTPAPATIARAAEEAGRDPAEIDMEGRLNWRPDITRDEIQHIAGAWRETGASHVAVDTMGQDLPSLDAHLEALAQVADALALR